MRRLVLSALLLSLPAAGQFVLQNSGITASLRGIAIGDAHGRAAWASGTDGTVLRTVDGGAHWMRCTTPMGAEMLDLRGIQAIDTDTAVVMSSGRGDASRIYRTTDGCHTWKLLLTNPDTPDGFFDALVFRNREEGWVLGDPVRGRLYVADTQDGGETWLQSRADGLTTQVTSGAFAASNQSLLLTSTGPMLGGVGAQFYRGIWPQCSQSTSYNDPGQCLDRIWFQVSQLPMASATSTSGIFALAENLDTLVAVGGEYTSPNATSGTAAWSDDAGITWHASAITPHGYRSSVAYDPATQTWIAVGPNGSDVSHDDGHTWQPLRPNPAQGDAPDADRDWNALALPWVVGPKGRIGKLRPGALREVVAVPPGSLPRALPATPQR